MDRLTSEAPEVARINNALADWRQGDVVRGPVDFIHMGDPARPLTALAGAAPGDGPTVDDFVEASQALQSRLKEKHDRQSDEGRALRALREIRVTAEPSWEAGQVTLVFWFIRHPEQRDFEGKAWDTSLETWLKLVKKTARYVAVRGLVVMLADVTAEDYVTSDPLDLDYLSLRGPRTG